MNSILSVGGGNQRKPVAVTLLVLLLFATSAGGNGPQPATNVLLERLLSLSGGRAASDELAEYKKWQADFQRIRAARDQSLDDTKLYLFAVFVVRARRDVHSSEEIARDLLPWFEGNSSRALTAMKQASVLVPSSCGALGDYFQTVSGPMPIDEFLSRHENEILSALGEVNGKACIEEITPAE